MAKKKQKNNFDWIFKQQKMAKKVLKPEIKYFPDVDILSIWFGGDEKVSSSIEVEDILFDFRKDGLILGVEINDASKYFKKKRRPKIKISRSFKKTQK